MRPDNMPRPYPRCDDLAPPRAPEPMMTNTELTAAIEYAHGCCDQKYTGGYNTGSSEVGKLMTKHLEALLECQLKRAQFLHMPPNAEITGLSG